ncbi:MAG: hypothetical protein ACJ8AS_02620 [Hyphomicrobiales bacterium]
MRTIDWTAQGTGAPGDIVKAAIPISGIFDLEPIRHTSINDVIGMDAGEARRQSPLFMEQPVKTRQLVVVGATKTEEFHRQSDEYCAGLGRQASRSSDTAGVDHFDLVNRFADAGSVFFAKPLRLIEATRFAAERA